MQTHVACRKSCKMWQAKREEKRTATTVSNCCLPWLFISMLACTIQVGVAAEGPAADAAHQRPRVQQHGQHDVHHLGQVPQQTVRAALRDCPERQNGALSAPASHLPARCFSLFRS